ncbi:MAG: SDR family oxidoreductase [Ignavibacteriales bacterium]|nr:MAG: SDR family oxidoreductase [Ignavibacteriaceae bacterium]MBW7873158.1 SDR family oxidoreductase [Ignavibacteria bacterium]MCZ2142800.1 SDR family oxidoreductase [Ignavibacteriales bacterium]OQY79763.1 MAG: NAD(P)-dependent oxidoreductase [Ignavibacteriales bacterium UTCHB3]MBV6443894.1 NADP-dependent 3-hydroxy acid dehydrogenase YdfG [Ignavibacteriaceae bacterium]
MNIKSKNVFITGASAGIGEATAQAFAQQGCNLILTARRLEKIESLASDIIKNSNVEVLPIRLDVRDRKAVFKAVDTIKEKFGTVDILVNNAGLGRGLEPLHQGEIDNWEEMIDTNIKGLLYVTKAVLPLMIENGSGHIINLGSVAGREVYPNGNVYCATKFSVFALSKALRIELYDKNIRTTTIDPGMVETEFSLVRFKGDEQRAKNVYKGFTPLKPEDIAETIIFCATRPPHVNITEMVIYPTEQGNTTLVKRSN